MRVKPALFAARKRPDRPPSALRPRGSADLAARPQRSERSETVERALDRWRVELVSLGGPNARDDMAALGSTVIDLSTAHPSGIAQLYAGRATPLSNLIRERTTWAAVRAKALAVQELAEEHAARYGLPPTHLSIGIAHWTDYVETPTSSSNAAPSDATKDAEVNAQQHGTVIPLAAPTQGPQRRPVARRVPILLRPIALGSDPRDLDLTLEPAAEVNPILVRALRSHGCVLDGTELAASAFSRHGFDPQPVLDQIEALGQTVLADFRVRAKLIVGVFEHPGQVLIEDLDGAGEMLANRTVVAALAGDRSARRVYAGQQLPEKTAADRIPDHERGIGDLTIDQQYVLDVIAKGHSVFIDAAPGAPTAATLAAIIADTIGSGRSVLYVTGNRRASHGVVAALREAGLGQTLLDLQPQPDWQRDAIEQLKAGLEVKPPSLDVTGIGQIRSALADRSRQIAEYVRALHGQRDPWNVSAYDALQAIAQVTSERPGTRTAVRLNEDVCLNLQTAGLERARSQIVRLAELGAFKLRREDSAWYGARISQSVTGQDVLARLDRLRGGTLAATLANMHDVALQSGLATPTTIEAWGEQLDMLQGIRGALDVFKPMVFERPPDQMVAATASQEWRDANGLTIGRVERSRFRRQAKDMVRPGVVVPDLHAALVHLQTQREIWMKHSPAVAWPKLPDGMATIDAEYRAVRADLDALTEVLGPVDGSAEGRVNLATVGFDELEAKLDHLHGTRSSLAYIPEITALRQDLAAAGLTELIDDLRSRRLGLAPPKVDVAAGPDGPLPILTQADQGVAHLVGFELDLAWWSSVLGFILTADKLLGTYNGQTLAALCESYRELDLAHIATKPGPIAISVAAWRDKAMQANPGQAAALAAARGSTLRSLVADCPEVALRARPCWLAGPMLVSQALPLAEVASPVLDLIILDAAAHISVAQAVPALARSAQVVVVGDSARLTKNSDSALAGLAAFLPQVVLQAPPASRDPRLAAFLAANGYATLAPPLPLPSRENLISFTPVEGAGQVIDGAANVESADTEVYAVVREVVAQVRLRSAESVAVVAISKVHVDRIRYALEATASSVPELAAALNRRNHEPLEVCEVTRAHGLQRDAIIFSPGFAKTPHGHVLYDFGPVSQEGGAGLLLDTLLACRHRLAVVSCLRASDLTPDRLRESGSVLFARLLEFAEQPGTPAEPHGEEIDALFADLSSRLAGRGFSVAARYGLDDGAKVPLTISHPSLPERELVAILTDDPAFVQEPSVRAQVRLRAAQLERLGWRTVHVWSPAVFMDPEAEARTISAIATAELERFRPGFTKV